MTAEEFIRNLKLLLEKSYEKTQVIKECFLDFLESCNSDRYLGIFVTSMDSHFLKRTELNTLVLI